MNTNYMPSSAKTLLTSTSSDMSSLKNNVETLDINIKEELLKLEFEIKEKLEHKTTIIMCEPKNIEFSLDGKYTKLLVRFTTFFIVLFCISYFTVGHWDEKQKLFFSITVNIISICAAQVVTEILYWLSLFGIILECFLLFSFIKKIQTKQSTYNALISKWNNMNDDNNDLYKKITNSINSIESDIADRSDRDFMKQIVRQQIREAHLKGGLK